MKSFLVLFSLFIINSCGNSKASSNQNNSSTSSEGIKGKYYVSVINNKNVATHQLSIEFDDKKNMISGFSGCNRYTSNYTKTAQSIKFSPLISTKKLCMDDKNNAENLFSQTITKVNKVVINDDGTINFSNNENILITGNQIKQNNITEISYSESTRGYHKLITINNKTISVVKKRNTPPTTKACTKANWEALINALKNVTIETISTLEAPTNKRATDMATIANLEIKSNGNTYRSSGFDGGTPPNEIATIVEEILSITSSEK